MTLHHLDDLPITDDGHGDEYQVKRRFLARAAGLRQVGFSWYEVPPGKKNWPLHFHHGNDEAFYFLSGAGKVRLGSPVEAGGAGVEEHQVGPGVFVGSPRGDPAGAHQVINTGAEPLVFLAVSGMQEPDVTEYVETGKIGVFAGGAPGTPDEARSVNEVHRRDKAVGYWD